MAKNDNLTDFLTDVADAIREKKGASDKINPQDFSSEIKSIYDPIAQGIPQKAVTFYDYDGTILYSYSKDEFIALEDMPPLPSKEGFTYQQWNWTYEDAVQHMAKYDILEVGASCITSDGKTRLYFSIDTWNNTEVYLRPHIYDTELHIDWGDGSEEIYVSHGGYNNIIHNYKELGDYCICITVLTGEIGIGDDINGHGLAMGNCARSLYKAELGENCFFAAGGFSDSNIQSINIPHGTTFISQLAFSNCKRLSFLCIPYGCKTICCDAFNMCRSLRAISLPNTLVSVGKNGGVGSIKGRVFSSTSLKHIYLSALDETRTMFNGCLSLTTLYAPDYTKVGESMFYGCGLDRIIIPEGIQIIEDGAFDNSYVAYIKFPSTLTKIVNHISYTKYLEVADFTACAIVPEFKGFYPTYYIASAKILVPDALFEEWLEKMIAESKYDYYIQWPLVSTDIIPTECLSLEIAPIDAEIAAKDKNARLKISAIVNGRRITTGEIVENAIYKTATYSEEFEANTSTEPMTRELTYTLLGVTATTTIAQAGADA